MAQRRSGHAFHEPASLVRAILPSSFNLCTLTGRRAGPASSFPIRFSFIDRVDPPQLDPRDPGFVAVAEIRLRGWISARIRRRDRLQLSRNEPFVMAHAMPALSRARREMGNEGIRSATDALLTAGLTYGGAPRALAEGDFDRTLTARMNALTASLSWASFPASQSAAQRAPLIAVIPRFGLRRCPAQLEAAREGHDSPRRNIRLARIGSKQIRPAPIPLRAIFEWSPLFRRGFGMGCGWPRRAGGGHHARQAFRTGEVGRPLALRVHSG